MTLLSYYRCALRQSHISIAPVLSSTSAGRVMSDFQPVVTHDARCEVLIFTSTRSKMNTWYFQVLQPCTIPTRRAETWMPTRRVKSAGLLSI